MTEKLYYSDSHMREFTANVVSCERAEGGWEIILDRTAFFPEGGGQPCDTGTICGANVLAVYERGEDVVHLADGEVSGAVECRINWEKRWRSMQTHSAEHIVSGIVHNLYGYENVGFHLGADGAVVDFDGYLSPEQLADIEYRANSAVWANVEIKTSFPTAEELKKMTYRSKLDLTENVRIVEIVGYDKCACCATHVSRTGEIGAIKITDSIRRHESGVRIHMIAGEDAYRDYAAKADAVGKISALLSAPAEATPEYAERILAEKAAAEMRAGELMRHLALALAESSPVTDGNIVLFEETLDADGLRTAVNAGREKCGGICAVFAGSDADGYRYCMGSAAVDLRERSHEINAALAGRGGGQPEMIQGSVRATRAEIEKYFG